MFYARVCQELNKKRQAMTTTSQEEEMVTPAAPRLNPSSFLGKRQAEHAVAEAAAQDARRNKLEIVHGV